MTPALAAEIRSSLSATPAHAAFRIPRVTWHLGRWIRTTDWYPDHQMRLYDRRVGALDRAVRARVGVGATARSASCAASCSTTRIATSPITSRPSIATRPTPRGRCARAAAAPACCRWPVIRRWRSCATTSLRGGFRDGAPGFIISALNAYYVFLKFAKLWELQRRSDRGVAKPASRPGRSPACNRAPDRHVLPAHRHGAHLARRPEPGAADRQRPARDRTSRGARRPSRRRAAAARGGGARPHPDRAADRDGPVGRLAAVAGASSGSARTSFTPTIRTASRWPRWRCRSGSATSGPAAGARRIAPRRLSPQGQLVLALEAPAGRLLHRGVRGDPADAARRRRAGRACGDGARGHRRRPHVPAAPPSTCTRRSGCRITRRSSATSPRSCRTRDSVI